MDWIKISNFDLKSLPKVNFVFDFLLPNGYLPFGYNKYTFPINVLENFKDPDIEGIYHPNGFVKESPIYNSAMGNVSVFEKNYVTDFTKSIIERTKNTKIISTSDVLYSYKKDEIYLVVFENLKYNTLFEIYSQDDFSIENLISPKLLELSKKYDNLKFVFIDVWEGAYEHNIKFLEKINSFLIDNKFNHTNKVIVSSNNNFITKLKEDERFLKMRNKIRLFSNNWLMLDAGKVLYQLNQGKETMVENGYEHSIQETIHYHDREKYFLMYNRNSERLHRAYFVNSLYENNLLEKGFVSFFQNDDLENYLNWNSSTDKDMVYEELKLTKQDLLPIHNNLYKFYPRYIEEESAERVGDLHNYLSRKREYQQSYFSIISETNAESDFCFITEKTMKPILNLHPFLVLGNPKTLEFLKSYGFKTFDKWWDESYDSEFDFKKRSNMVLDIVKDLCSKTKKEMNTMIEEMSEILYHNQKQTKKLYDKKIFEKQFFSHVKEKIKIL